MSITVSTLVKYLKTKLDSDAKLQSVQVTGELSNFHRHSSGHLYFTLKDDKSQIACVMFSSRAQYIKFEPKNGDKVEISANTSIFEVSGQLQLYVNSLKLAGVGDLYQQYEELKNKLANEGYFDDDHKIEQPTLYPEKIAVLVGENSAAMSDIKTCFERRWPIAKVDYYPVLVQGKDAPKDIISTLNVVDDLDYEIIILARGGGSFEDLFCFNDEELVKTIYNLNTFIITGIGHEQDYTLSDFVSDERAPTPTACVELTTNDIKDVLEEIKEYKEILDKNINNLLENTSIKVDYYFSKISNYISTFKLLSSQVNLNKDKLNISIKNILKSKTDSINSYKNLLKAYSIDNTLKRGFSLVYKDSKLIKNKNLLKINDDINVQLYGGNIKATVKEA